MLAKTVIQGNNPQGECINNIQGRSNILRTGIMDYKLCAIKR